MVYIASLTRRVTELTRAELLCIGGGDQLDFVSAGDPNIVRVKAFPAPRVAVAPNKRSEEVIAASAQMGSNYGRMEVVNQPWGEWQVDLARQWCPCNYGFVFGMCVHVLYALGVSPYV
ncbi:hypothetical protein GQ600_6019 [Phytophthora cactorum]|nr:hypothetical protein GQ600_6019 [Phytophthora cactorum]